MRLCVSNTCERHSLSRHTPLVTKSRLNDKLAWLSNASGTVIKAHGDSAYPRRSHLLKHASYRMAQKRICVEWAFGKMQQIFAVTDFEAHLQVLTIASSFLIHFATASPFCRSISIVQLGLTLYAPFCAIFTHAATALRLEGISGAVRQRLKRMHPCEFNKFKIK